MQLRGSSRQILIIILIILIIALLGLAVFIGVRLQQSQAPENTNAAGVCVAASRCVSGEAGSGAFCGPSFDAVNGGACLPTGNVLCSCTPKTTSSSGSTSSGTTSSSGSSCKNDGISCTASSQCCSGNCASGSCAAAVGQNNCTGNCCYANTAGGYSVLMYHCTGPLQNNRCLDNPQNVGGSACIPQDASACGSYQLDIVTSDNLPAGIALSQNAAQSTCSTSTSSSSSSSSSSGGPVCGDSIKDATEECDPQATPTGCASGDICSTSCTCSTPIPLVCGDPCDPATNPSLCPTGNTCDPTTLKCVLSACVGNNTCINNGCSLALLPDTALISNDADRVLLGAALFTLGLLALKFKWMEKLESGLAYINASYLQDEVHSKRKLNRTRSKFEQKFEQK